ncbi:glycosyl transferase [candidate division WOR-3 bacterium JGI_Cruoil_03_44_89]|uniref:Glycosyl transferase n=1 Tax=candidate division WOR-3 bacterium JGI_Cruoil_03_44_89 TaxID=1973748 RepID=A0A235BNE6_UNCW3|nr:MAG: glycosyl transferase [candidate division WOR-3 bacterium JGI_Cruoil_03_44_89]
MRVAIVHDYMNQFGGAERVLWVVHEIFPEAPVYTILMDMASLPTRFRELKVTPTFIQHLPFARSQYEKYILLFPTAIEQIDLSSFDLVISISSAWAKGCLTNPSTCHLSYILSPMRFVWERYYERMRGTASRGNRTVFRFVSNYLRMWDKIAAERPDYIITLSKEVKRRIKKYYRREADIIYPPCDTSFFTIDPKLSVQDFFLIVSRLRPYKRIDIAIEAFNRLGLPLLIIGEGSERGRLERLSRRNIQFLGRVSDEEVRSYVRRAQALVFPGLEDFGITPVEALACGTPVIAYRGGGLLESMLEGVTGRFFDLQEYESLVEAVKGFDRGRYDRNRIREHALKFSREAFKEKFGALYLKLYEEYNGVKS